VRLISTADIDLIQYFREICADHFEGESQASATCRIFQPSYRCFASIGGTPLFKKLLDLCFPFTIISWKRDLNIIAIGCFL
jgi:hypothetical protein